ncbi:MAG: acyl-CoA dehydrogenase family protein [Saprospiraceae bacterium]|nr:acyl-CoA dehydrogenase family protein [Saprospiraceae bacterium]
MPNRLATYSPGVRSFIPLLYVAWADGLLSPSEVKLISDKIASLDELSGEDKDLIRSWIDPSKWPHTSVFRDWIRLIKEYASESDGKALRSISVLGQEMAKRSAIQREAVWEGSKTFEALNYLEEEIGIAGVDKFRSVSAPRVDITGPTPDWTSAEMQEWMDGPSKEIKDRVKAFLSDPIFEYAPNRGKEEYREKVLAWLRMLGQQGFGALGFPVAYGGMGDTMQYAAVFEVLGYHDLSLAVKFGVQFGLFGGSVLNLGTKYHHDKYLHRIGSMDLPGCFAMTETGHGSNVRDIETMGRYDPDTGEIEVHSPTYTSGKEYIGNALHAQMATVFVQLVVQGENHGVHAVLVPIRDQTGDLLPGIKVEDNGYKLGLNGVDNGRIWFDHVRVPRENLLNRFGQITLLGRYESQIPNPSKRFFTMLGTLVAGRICVAKGALSAAKSALTIAIRYALHRRQFKPDPQSAETLLLDYPSHQRRLMPKLATAYALHFALQQLIKKYAAQGNKSDRDLEALAAGLKSRTTWFTTDTVQECRESCGGKGYLRINRFADLKADSDIFSTFEGDNTVLLQLVAKSLLSNFKEDFNDAGLLGVIRYMGEQVSDQITRLNPVYKRKTDASHLKDVGFHIHAVEFRERKLLYSLGERVRQMFRKRITPYDVFLRTQNHMISLANAYVDRSIIETFQGKLSELEEGPVKKSIIKVYQLYALHQIATHQDWYLEQDYMEGAKTKAIRRQIERLCLELRKEAAYLVAAFGIPDGLLGAPIAFGEF